jgi:CBS-domain-containing membrane protein
MRVEQLMTRPVHTCRREETLEEAARILWEKDCGCLPVVDEQMTVVGMITDRDICMAAYTQGRALHDLTVASAMSATVLTCRPQDTAAHSEYLMRARSVRRLPVVDDDGVVVGLLSLNDLALWAGQPEAAARKSVSEAEVCATLAAVCRHRAAGELVPVTRRR